MADEMSALRKQLEKMPPGTLVPAAWVLSELGEAEKEVRWVGISAAAEISQMSEPALRSAAPKWLRMQDKGEAPPIRVRKKGDSSRAHWLFDEAGCWELRPADPVQDDVVTPPLEAGQAPTIADFGRAYAVR